MNAHPHDIDWSSSDPILTDGGLETALVFLDGIDLPHFAAFPLLDREEGRAALRRYYEGFLGLAAEQSLGFVLDTPTWRANPDWAPRLGYDLAGLGRVNRAAVAFVAGLRDEWAGRVSPLILDGVVGPRGDGYKDGTMDPSEAQDYHSLQIEAFAQARADLVSAITMTTTGEAIGIARAARAAGLPHVISFTVETDGRLVGGATLREAIEATEAATEGSPLHYMVNCAHPTHFEGALARGEAWATRIGGLRANASRMSHAELDGSPTLDAGDPEELGASYADLRRRFPRLKVLGGCCGTDHRHVAAIRNACLAVPARPDRSRQGRFGAPSRRHGHSEEVPLRAPPPHSVGRFHMFRFLAALRPGRRSAAGPTHPRRNLGMDDWEGSIGTSRPDGLRPDRASAPPSEGRFIRPADRLG